MDLTAITGTQVDLVDRRGLKAFARASADNQRTQCPLIN